MPDLQPMPSSEPRSAHEAGGPAVAHAGAPWPVWAAGAIAALLHALPFLRTRLERPAPGQAWLGVPYIPEDWFAYVALVRERPRPGQLLLANPFTTDPQDGRFVLLFHHALNLVHRATGIEPGVLLELARAGLVVLFAVVLYRFLEGVHASARTRTWAVVLALLSGGFDFAARWAARWLPAHAGSIVRQDLWSMNGWTTHHALYNPLWVLGLVLLLVALRPLLKPGGPASVREVAGSGAAMLALWLVHPYSAMAAVAIAAAAAAGEWLVTGAYAGRRPGWMAAAVLAPALVTLAVMAWQVRDPVFRATSGGLFGDQVSSIFYYPIAWGVVGLLALRGARSWIAGAHPWRYPILGWIAGIALLHSSPVVGGYHFLPYAYLPVAILAAGPVSGAFDRLRGAASGALGAVALATVLFAGTAANAAGAFAEVAGFQLPLDYDAALASLAALPPGNVLCDGGIGNAVPAYGPHRVFVGQWFMTPDRKARGDLAARALGPGGGALARELVESQRIDYVLAPTTAVPELSAALADLAPRVEAHGAVSVVALRGR